MPDIIVFVCHIPEFVQHAERELREHDARLEFLNVQDEGALNALAPAVLNRARLIGFTTPVIVPPAILGALGYGAYNFHPGPPEYPGYEPLRFALYDGVLSYGVTAHVMQRQVDSGPIVGVRRFGVRPNVGYDELQARMAGALMELFQTLARPLSLDSAGPPPIAAQWSQRRYTRKQALALCDLPADIDETDLRRRIRAFGSGEFPLRPVVKIHGQTFVHFPDEILYPK